MQAAIFNVHAVTALFMSNNGYEFGLALLAISVALALNSAGPYSLDRVLSRPRTGARLNPHVNYNADL
ncbi:MAG TPA: hypothetical protein VIS52_03460 [Motiliproteus sp.]